MPRQEGRVALADAGVIGLQAQGGFEMGLRVIDGAGGLEQQGQVGVRLGVVRLDSHGGAKLLHRVIDAARCIQGKPEIVVRRRIVGPQRQRLSKRRNRLVILVAP